MLLASFSFLHLHLHEVGPCRAIEAEWRGFVSSTFLREAVKEALALARQHQISGWIADDRRLGPVRPADLEWIATNAVPTLIDIGVQRFAQIEAEDPLNKLLINKTVETVVPELPMQLRKFTDVEAARAWACSAT